MSYLEQMHNTISNLSRPGGACDWVIEVAQRFGVLFQDTASNMHGRHRVHIAMNRVLWPCVVSLGAMDY
jgi:hypothetical protein